MARTRTLHLAVANVVLLAACSKTPAPSRAPAPPPRASFTVHEWGLFGLDIAADARLAVASGTQRIDGTEQAIGDALRDVGAPVGGFGGLGFSGSGVGGGKPVVYVHLDPGVDTARFSLSVDVPRASVREVFPSASVEDARFTFGPVVATRGRCATPTPPPTGETSGCTGVADHYCEAAEIPRYHADDDTCLTTSGQSSELLFYRAAELDPARLPLVLERTGDTYALRAREGATLEGPVLFVERKLDGTVHLRALAAAERSGPVTSDGGSTNPSDSRALLTAHARRLGLTEAEADAFIDAWAPAIFDGCHRTGPEASGAAPRALGVAEVSLLYFAPRALVDAMLPLTTDPPARQVDRAFLVRVVDGSRPSPLALRIGTLGSSEVNGTLGGWSLGGRPPDPSAPRRPRIRVDTPRTTHGLDPNAVRRVTQRHLNEVVFCYEQQLAQHPDLAGDLGIAFVVTSTGAVRTASAQTPIRGNAMIGTCTANAVRRWTFPAPDPSGDVTVNLTFHLSPPS